MEDNVPKLSLPFVTRFYQYVLVILIIGLTTLICIPLSNSRSYHIVSFILLFVVAMLARNSGRVLTHQFILKEVWGYGYQEQTQYLRVFIARLRKKVEANPANPVLLITESGIGYRFGN